MNKGDIERYLQLLGQELQIRNITGTILLLGGAVMLLEVGNRATTQDRDASFEGSNAPLIRQAVVMIAQRCGQGLSVLSSSDNPLETISWIGRLYSHTGLYPGDEDCGRSST